MKPTLRIKQSWPKGFGKPIYQAYSSHPQIHRTTGYQYSVAGAYFLAKKAGLCASHV